MNNLKPFNIYIFVKCMTNIMYTNYLYIELYTLYTIARIHMPSKCCLRIRLVNYVWNVTAATAAAVVAKTTMLINSFPHPAVTGSDLAATLTMIEDDL